MPKNKLKKFAGLNDLILKLIKKHRQLTTFAIKRMLVEQGTEVTWKTVKRYLDDLEKEEKLKSTTLEYNDLVIWSPR